MAINGRFRVAMEDVFPHGAYGVSEVAATRDFDESTKEPYVDESGGRPRVAYSIRASGMHAPGKRAASPAGETKVA